MKIWADKYAFPCEIKNGADLIRPKIIVVTSNYSIRDIFPAKEDYEPLERRFKVIHKKESWRKNPFNMLDTETVVMPNGKWKSKLPDYRIPTESIVGKDAWEAAAKKSFKNSKKRKFDQPLKAKKPLKQNKDGQIVINNDKQLVIEEALVNAIKEKEIINIADTSSEEDAIDCDKYDYNYEVCEHCGFSILCCLCMLSDEVHTEEVWSSEEDCSDCEENNDGECSEDLFDI